ncbi:MAG: hypothetical protein HHAS10_05600 [Candidatus Altimarinota bacterium]
MDSPQVVETENNVTPEELLGPPKYDPMGILMTFLSSLIVGVVAGIIIMLASYFAIGRFTLESGASPILLVFVAFVGLTIGNLIYVSLLGYIFPHVFGRNRTSFSQVMISSIILYIFFIPVYTVITTVSTEMRIILIAFSAHVVMNAFSLNLLMGIISRYRYSILSFYSSLISMLVTAMLVIYVQSLVSKSETSLFVLLGLPILAYVLSGVMTTAFSWIYYKIYQASGSDPLGSVFGRIEEEERALENEAIQTLTQFQSKK